MRRIILAPDSFKGTMSAIEVCGIMDAVARKHFPLAEIIKMPVADGGEGTVDCFLAAAGGDKVKLRVKGPYFEEIEAGYGILPDGRTAVVEMAAASGLPLVEGRRNPAETTTYGVGEMITHALKSGCTRIILGLGGSCTNDGGAGMAAALGVVFHDEAGKAFVPTGGSLNRVTCIDTSGRLDLADGASVIAACDVDNPLCGKNGAAFVYGPQKGADPAMVEMLDNNLLHFSQIIKRDLGLDLADYPGAGAAGGMGAGVRAFLGAELRPGIDIVLDTLNFDSMLEGCDLVITGEGRIDSSSLMGKVISGISRRTRRKGVPLVAIGGGIEGRMDGLYEAGVSAVMSINPRPEPFEQARTKCFENLEFTVDTLMRLIKLNESRR